MNLTPELQKFEDLELAVGPATLRGVLERHAPPEATPSLTLDLSGNEIDLDAIRALASLITGDDAGEDVLDHSVAATLKADRFTALGVAADDVDTVFTLSEGELALQRLSIGNLEGATISASGQLSGSLLAYTGTGSARLEAEDPSAFFSMLRDRLPHHPALDQLTRSGRWFAGTSLAADLTFGGDIAGAAVRLTGTSNGSRIAAELALPTVFDVTAGSDFSFNLQAENEQSPILLAQAGLEPLPLADDGAARLSLALHSQGTDPAALTFSYDTDSTHASAKGSFELGSESFGIGQGEVTLRSQDLEPYLLMTGIGLPQFGTGLPVGIASGVAVSSDAVRLTKLTGELAGNSIASQELVIGRSGTLPSLAGEVSFDTLDLAWLGEAAYGALTDPATGALSDKPFSLPIFGAAEARLQVQAKTFRPGMFGNVTGFTGTIAHRNGGVALEDMAGDWKGGRVTGRLAMSSGEGTGIFQTRLTIDNADLASVVWQSGGAPVATGRVNATLSAEATAQSPAALMAALNGSGELRLSDLVIEGIDPAALPAVLAQADQLEGEVTEEKVLPVVERSIRAGAARVGTVMVPFTITEGEVRAQNVAASIGDTRFVGEIRIDPLEDVLNGAIDVTYGAGDEALAGGEPTVRFGYSGTVKDPQVEVSVAPLANFLSLRAFERERRRVEALQASVLEKQRLRREVALYRYLAAERQAARDRAEAEEQSRREEEARRQAEAAAQAERVRAEAATRAAEQERRRQEQSPPPVLSLPPSPDVFRQDLPPLQAPTLQNLPGVEP